MASAAAFVDYMFRSIAGTPMPHGFIEAALVIALMWLLFRKSYDPRGTTVGNISDSKFETILKNWNPEPLVKDVNKGHPALKPRLITGKVGKFIEIDGVKCLNLGSHNYLGFLGNSEIEECAIKTVEKYGVGSCGPRGFYGTVDVHMALEEQLAAFTGMEEAAVFSYGFSTIASVIPAYAKRADVIFVDKEVNFAVQKGLDASRSRIVMFEHNDVEHLENLLIEQEKLDKKNRRKASASRRFLVVEGIYMNTGTICPLPELMRLKDKYKLRLFIDESVSFGTLGASGKGVTEHYGVPVRDVDLIVASLEWAVGSIGGFSVGSAYTVEHQRLSALGYCFSASLPPLLTTAAATAIRMMQDRPSMFAALKERCRQVHSALETVADMDLLGDPQSPIKHLVVADALASQSQQDALIASVVDYCHVMKVAVVSSAYLPGEHIPRRPSLRIAVNVMLEDPDVLYFTGVLKEAVSHARKQL